MYTTSGTLLERLRSRTDQAAWDRFVLIYTPFLYYCVRKFDLNEEDSADVVQDVFAQLLVKLPQFQYDTGGSFRAWLKTVTLNKCRERSRDRQQLPVGGSSPAVNDIAAESELEALWESEYREHLVSQALKIMQAEFEPATWRACWLYVVESRPVSDVARELGISTGSVYTYSSRVLRRLRQELPDLI
jgi:RNA polymerase sigma-70 factor (ECF subfamily)